MSVLHEPLWNELAAQLRPFLLRRVSPSDVDDVLQDVFLRVQRALSELRDEERFTAWLFRIARSSVAEHCRARARHPLTPPIETDGAEVVDDAPVLACCVAAFVARLPALYCEALTLVELEERSMQDAADRVGISATAMKSRAQRGRAQLRALFEECCDLSVDTRGRVIDYERRTCRTAK